MSKLIHQPTTLQGDVIAGDTVRSATGRLAMVLKANQQWPDGTIEHYVRPILSQASGDEDDDRPTYYLAVAVRRLVQRDPYRRYLTLCAAEDNAARVVRRLRQGRHVRRFGPYLPVAVWDKMFWRLTNQRRLLPTGESVCYDIGREHWKEAALDCLTRRDRAMQFWLLPGSTS